MKLKLMTYLCYLMGAVWVLTYIALTGYEYPISCMIYQWLRIGLGPPLIYQNLFPLNRKCLFGCTGNGNVTAVAVGQSQRLYSDVRMLTGNYLSFL